MKRRFINYRLISVFMIVCVVVTSVCPVYAACLGSSSSISAEYFCDVVKAEYEKYGIECEINCENLIRDLTMEDLEEAVAKANIIGKNSKTSYEIVDSEIEIIRPDPAHPDYIQANFKYTYDWTNGDLVTFVARYQTVVEGRVDMQGSNIMGFDRYEHIFKSGMNYVSTDIRSSTVTDLGGADVRWSVSGYTLFSWTDPSTGVSFQNNVPFSMGTTFNAQNYTT